MTQRTSCLHFTRSNLTQLLTWKICLSGFEDFVSVFLDEASITLLIFSSVNFSLFEKGQVTFFLSPARSVQKCNKSNNLTSERNQQVTLDTSWQPVSKFVSETVNMLIFSASSDNIAKVAIANQHKDMSTKPLFAYQTAIRWDSSADAQSKRFFRYISYVDPSTSSM